MLVLGDLGLEIAELGPDRGDLQLAPLPVRRFGLGFQIPQGFFEPGRMGLGGAVLHLVRDHPAASFVSTTTMPLRPVSRSF